MGIKRMGLKRELDKKYASSKKSLST